MFVTRRRTAFSVLIASSLVLGAACGGGGDSGGSVPDDSVEGTITLVSDPANDTNEPEVSIPEELPTDLVVTDLVEGTGPEAVDTDTVYVYYVGVLSKDGTRFDGNYGLEAFGVTLGTGSVIEGWEEGLLGIKAGGRRQLDIPADLAYGENGAGDIIQPGDALSFVVDVVAIVPKVSRRDEPREEIEGRDPVTEVEIEDLIEGTGPTIEFGDRVILHLQAYRADTGELLETTWEFDEPLDINLVEGSTLDGILKGIPGMKPGGRRIVVVPFAEAFGPEGNSELGLPAETDLIFVFDVFAIIPSIP